MQENEQNNSTGLNAVAAENADVNATSQPVQQQYQQPMYQQQPVQQQYQQPMYQQPVQQQYQQPMYQPPVYQQSYQAQSNYVNNGVFDESRLPEQYKPLSPWAYFGYNILFAIPLVGLICLFIFAFSNQNINRRNFARSYFCSLIIAVVLVVLIAFVGGSCLSAIIGSGANNLLVM